MSGREPEQADVAVVGGGLAGLATAIHLKRHGKTVVCIEPRPWPRPAVGESLDFSAVALLEELGVSAQSLLAAQGGFDKEAIEIITPEADPVSLWPPDWFAKPPIRCSMFALHVDRAVLDNWIARIAAREGVTILEDCAKAVHASNGTIERIETEKSGQIGARWFVDATGKSVRLFGRSLDLERVPLGRTKISQWARFRTPPRNTATTFYIQHPRSDYLEWIWEIPLSSTEVSVGCVLTTDTVKRLRREGFEGREMFEARLKAFDRLASMVSGQPDYELNTTSFTPSCYRRPIGPNWLMVGDAAAFADPLTSNGVTASLRHAKLAASVIDRSIDHQAPRRSQQWLYRQSTDGMVRALDKGIEGLVYGSAIRQWLGVRMAVILYAFFGIITNSIYSSLRPANVGPAILLSGVLATGQTWITVWRNTGRMLRSRRFSPRP